MKTQHTPGPWKVRERGSENHQDNGAFVSVMPDLDGSEKWHAYNICSIYSPMDTKNSAYHPTQEQLANARLIAAAPELLEALSWAITFVKDLRYDEQKAKKEEILKLLKTLIVS